MVKNVTVKNDLGSLVRVSLKKISLFIDFKEYQCAKHSASSPSFLDSPEYYFPRIKKKPDAY